MTYSSYQVKAFTWKKSYRHLFTHPSKESSAWTEVWSGSYRARLSIMVPGGRFGRFFRIFGGLMIHSSYQVKAFTWRPWYIRKQGTWRLDQGLDYFWSLKGVYYGSRGSRSGRFKSLGGLVTYSSYQVKAFTWKKSYRHLFTHPSKESSAWTEVWSGSYRARLSIMVPGGRFGRFFRIFGGLVTYSSYQMKTITWIKSYRHLATYPSKESSARGTV